MRRANLIIAGCAALVASLLVPGAASAAASATVTGLSPDHGKQYTAVAIEGTGLGAATAVSFDGKPGTNLTHDSATRIEVEAPAHSTGAVQVTVRAGSSTLTVPGTFTYRGAPPNLTFSKPRLADPVTGAPAAVSCVDGSFCVGVDRSDQAFVYRHGTWAKPVRLGFTYFPTSVSCVTSSFCRIGGLGGQIVAFDGKGFSSPHTLPNTYHGSTLTDVTCVTKRFCTAVTGATGWWFYNGSAWMRRDAPQSAQHLYGVSCVASHFCLAVGYRQSQTHDASGFSAPISTPVEVTTVSCLPSEHCVAVAPEGSDDRTQAVEYDGSWRTPVDVGSGSTDPAYEPENPSFPVSCSSETSCRIGVADDVVSTDGPALTGLTSTHLAGINVPVTGVSCPTDNSCVAVDANGGSYRYSNSAWSARATAVVTHGGIREVSCPTSTFCMAIDDHANAVELSGGKWRTPVHLDNRGLLIDVSCSSEAFCAAVDEAGYAKTFAHGHWQRVATRISETALYAVSCLSSNFCLALTSDNRSVEWDGTRWEDPVLIASNGYFGAIDCHTTTCYATGDEKRHQGAGEVAKYNGTSWSTPEIISNADTGIDSVNCVSPTRCVVGAYSTGGDETSYGDFYLTGTVWSPFEYASSSEDGFPSEGMSCPSSLFCAQVYDSEDGDGAPGVVLSDVSGSTNARVRYGKYPSIFSPGSVSCPQDHNCVVASGNTVERGTR